MSAIKQISSWHIGSRGWLFLNNVDLVIAIVFEAHKKMFGM